MNDDSRPDAGELPINAEDINLHEIIDATNPDNIYKEVRTIALCMHPDFQFDMLDLVFADIRLLFKGEYPGYRQANTQYHDLRHTLEVFLCTARLLHGAHVEGVPMGKRALNLALVGALFHDTGLIQTDDDREGTGAKYTIGHEQRSTDFLKSYMNSKGQPPKDLEDTALMIACTNLGVNTHDMAFPDQEVALAAKAMATADLLAQMADREYLEKLLLLYLEFREAGLPYESMYDLLQKTHGFYAMARNRLAVALDGVSAFMLSHFKARWNMDRDLYNESMEKNMDYLHKVLEAGDKDFMSRLKRGGIINRVVKIMA